MGGLLGLYDLDGDIDEPCETHIDRLLKRLAIEPTVDPGNKEA